jgi:ABC-2 type transport system permease protein
MELRRLMRNRRAVMFTLVLPAVLFISVGPSHKNNVDRAGVGNVTAYILISMAVYGAMLSSTSAGASVSIERAAGWTRQLRLTPLKPIAYIAVKLLMAFIVGGASVAVVYLVGSRTPASMPAHVWIISGVLAWACAMVFAAFGLFMGYLLPTENVMQVLGPVLGVLAFFGGLFGPASQFGSTFETISRFMPTYGVGSLARYPLDHSGHLYVAILSVVAWTSVFAAGAAWRFRRDTKRV